MITRLRQSLEHLTKPRSSQRLFFGRPLLVVQSDDWGRVGVRDHEGWEELCASGIKLGEKPYDFYSLETADDLDTLAAVLRKHRDSVGRSPSVVMNFITANVDFPKSNENSGEIFLKPLTEGLPGSWQRPGLFEAYQRGIHERLFFPALHGLTHFCTRSISRELQAGGQRSHALKAMWGTQTPYIHWRMPWIGFEYWDPAMASDQRFLSLEQQRIEIQRAAGIYRQLFGASPLSACAPGYRANADTKVAWFKEGVRVVQCGPGRQKTPSLDQSGMLCTFRNIEIEPAIAMCKLDDLVREVERCFADRVPAIVSIHSINFHSTLKDFRTPTLSLLDQFLDFVEKRWPDLLYVHDADLFRIVTEGVYSTADEDVNVAVTTAREGSPV